MLVFIHIFVSQQAPHVAHGPGGGYMVASLMAPVQGPPTADHRAAFKHSARPVGLFELRFLLDKNSFVTVSKMISTCLDGVMAILQAIFLD
jgi:hypothetical protein